MSDRDKLIVGAILLWLLWPRESEASGYAETAYVGWTIDEYGNPIPVPLTPPPEPVPMPIPEGW